MILSSGMLVRELNRLGDDFITVEIDGREYIIEAITHKPNYTESPCTHLCLRCRDGGQGEIKRKASKAMGGTGGGILRQPVRMAESKIQIAFTDVLDFPGQASSLSGIVCFVAQKSYYCNPGQYLTTRHNEKIRHFSEPDGLVGQHLRQRFQREGFPERHDNGARGLCYGLLPGHRNWRAD